jgi:TonB-dependent receptor
MTNMILSSVIRTSLLAAAILGSQASAQSTAAEPAASTQTPAAAQNVSPRPVEEVVVTGFRQSLEQGIELKREAIAVRDSIVAEDIGKFPEMNVAESLQRIPGVFMNRDGASNEGQRIFLRGLGSQYTMTTINSMPVRTTSGLLGNVGSSTRDFNYDVFPSELFGRVDVYKTPLANLEEGGIAGNVDLQTPRPFDSSSRIIRYGVSGSYNDQSEETTPRASLLLSDTWGNFGALIGVAYAENINERSGFQSTGGYNSTAIARTFYYLPNGTPRPSSSPAAANTFGPFNYELDLNSPLANLGSYTAEEVAGAFLPRFYRVYSSNNERERLGATTSLQYKTDRLDISLDGIFSRLKDQAGEFTWGVPVRGSRTVAPANATPGTGNNSGLIPIDVHIDEFNNLYGTFANTSLLTESFYRDSETDFNYGVLRGTYDFTDSLKLSGWLNASESKAWYSENRIVSNIFGVETTFDPTVNVTYPTISTPVDIMDPSLYRSASNGFFLNRETDKEEAARLQLDWSLGDWIGVEWSTLIGGSRVSTTKKVQRQDGSALGRAHELPGGGTFTSLGNGVFNFMDQSVPYGRLENGGNAGYPSTFPTFSRSFVMNDMAANAGNKAAPILFNQAFTAEEVVTAGFVELNGETDIAGHGLRGNVGVRYVDTETLIDNYAAAGGGQFAPAHSEGGYDNVLPSLSLAFDVTSELVLRASAGKTLTRAALSNIASGTLVPSIFNHNITQGNPDLKPQVAKSLDGSLEWYFAEGGLLSVAYFKKNLEGTPRGTDDTVTLGSTGLPDSAFDSNAFGYGIGGDIPDSEPLTRTRFTNVGPDVKLDGLELAYQQSFSFLPAPFDGLGAVASYTMIDTQGNDFITEEGRVISVPLVPEDSYSATAYYEKGPFAVRATYTYRAETGTNSVNTGTDLNSGNDQIAYLSESGYLDATISYKITDALELRLDGLNLTNEDTFIYYEDPDGPAGNGSSRRDNSFYNGRTLSFGIRGQF